MALKHVWNTDFKKLFWWRFLPRAALHLENTSEIPLLLLPRLRAILQKKGTWHDRIPASINRVANYSSCLLQPPLLLP